MDELKPCPFCGSENVKVVRDDDDWEFVRCRECLACGPPIVDSALSARKHWTRRADSWVPVTERLPEEGHRVPVDGNRLAFWEHGWWWDAFTGGRLRGTVTWWYELPPTPPLPEPEPELECEHWCHYNIYAAEANGCRYCPRCGEALP